MAKSNEFKPLAGEQLDEATAEMLSGLSQQVYQLDVKIVELEKKINADREELEARIQALEELLVSQKEAVAPPAGEPIPTLTGEAWTHGKKKYRLTVPQFVLGDTNYTEQDVLTSPELRKELVEGGYGVFEPVED